MEFNQGFVREMLQEDADGNRTHLVLAQNALHDILAEDLTERQREILTMHYYDKCSVTQIAQRLHISKSTVSRTMSRAKRRIQKHMRFYFDYTNYHLN